jgi:CBS domain-containing protein
MSEYPGEDFESLEGEFRKLEESLLSDAVKILTPREPIRLAADASVDEAIGKMIDARRAGVVIVDAQGKLRGIFTERDVLLRVIRERRDPAHTRLGDVMTADPEALTPDDRICYAVNRMHVGGFRTVPVVDGERRPIGIVTVNDIVGWLADIFPEAILNLRPGDKLRRPSEIDSG